MIYNTYLLVSHNGTVPAADTGSSAPCLNRDRISQLPVLCCIPHPNLIGGTLSYNWH